MLGIGMQEIIIILIVALIIIGPKKLPDLARALGRAMGEFRRAADDLKDNLDINGMKADKEKLMREITENQLNLEKKSEPVLSIRNVTKKFGGLTAVNNVNLDVYPGEILGIVGDNGAGKSTLIKMVTGVYPPDSGKIYFENEGIDGKSPQEVRNLGIETIYQDLALVGSLDASANVFLGKEVIRNRFMGSLNIKYMRKETNE